MVRSLSHEGEYQGDTFPASLESFDWQARGTRGLVREHGSGRERRSRQLSCQVFFQYQRTANCDSSGSTQPDFVVYSTGLAGSATRKPALWLTTISIQDVLLSPCLTFIGRTTPEARS